MERHDKIINKLLRSCHKIDRDMAAGSSEKTDEYMGIVSKKLFPASSDNQLYIQMSEEISPEDYDLYEEDHAYFKEMMARMLEEFKIHQENKKDCRALELGAGTGHFTKRLAQQPIQGLEVVAVEYDKRCYYILRNKFLLHKHVRTEHGDSVTYNPDGDFDCVFSSFAEHHISPDQKKAYFQNLKNNMRKNSRFIVGDEFLRPHDRNNDARHFEALKAYHNYIIDVATDQGHFGLVALENDALRCGKERKVDFKMSLEDYKAHLTEAGLVCEKRLLISPKDKETEIGGIYVLVIRLSQ